jgi:hypothetical protein
VAAWSPTAGRRRNIYFLRSRKCERILSPLPEKVVVGAIIDRPRILLKQNLSPQGENRVIFHREIRRTSFFGGRAMLAPTYPDGEGESARIVRSFFVFLQVGALQGNEHPV